ncbi:flavodoxin family protein [Methanobrevibacter sp. TMH8]|uniref:flavodoxin family protein n=1 Tax=Methanobrevibacter sp. TMH8 TaxID=2848611 RepID=UPI001CD035AD|nr:flavodoxin family protein [Methanobrevibacter sp. TMH8]MBZ9570970.1 flavodoxin family protein [Methanobrevibacter sp. TMH8]
MKVIGINGSPRKNWNTGTLLNKVLDGVKSIGGETELINLYKLKYGGCISCFHCKKKDEKHGICAINDDLSPVLEKLKDADSIAFASPVYFMNISSGLSAFLERFLFSNMIYSNEIPTVFPKTISSAFIYTMNITENQMREIGLEKNLKAYQHYIYKILGMKPELLYAYNTYQFSDYNKYESSIFSKEDKAKYKEEQFPIDCKKAFDIGINLLK